jgi:hypothetical protein
MVALGHGCGHRHGPGTDPGPAPGGALARKWPAGSKPRSGGVLPWLLDWPVGRSDEFLELAGCQPARAAGPKRSLRVLDGLDAGAGDPSWRGLSALVRGIPERTVGPKRRRGVGVMAQTSENA